MTRIHFKTDKGRAVCLYPGQYRYQGQYVQVYQSGTIYFSYNSEIGSATPISVYNGTVLRFWIGGLDRYMTQKIRKQIYNDCKDLFQTIVNGFSEKWSDRSSCWIGVLTDEAKKASEELQYRLMFNYEP